MNEPFGGWHERVASTRLGSFNLHKPRMKIFPLLSLLIALPSICHATVDATVISTEIGTQLRLPVQDGRSEPSSDCCPPIRPTSYQLGSGAVITSPGGDFMPSLGNGIPYPAVVEPAPGGQIVIRGGEIRLSSGDGILPPSVSAVPEPQRYAMLLSGLVVISGLMVRRK